MIIKEMTIKLVFDTKSNKVIFAQASKDFVDFLFFLLSLPIGTAIKLITSESMVGSIGNIYTSVANLDQKYMHPNMRNKNILLNPKIFQYTHNIPLLITESSIISSGKFYTCSRYNCKGNITNMFGAVRCSNCSTTMDHEVKFVAGSEGYVKELDYYIVSEDFSVTVMSTMSIVLMMNKFNASDIEEKEFKVGTKEGLELLKTSFQSTTVLTDVFLGRKKVKRSIKSEG